jgi:type VI protein secretion system component Hcp
MSHEDNLSHEDNREVLELTADELSCVAGGTVVHVDLQVQKYVDKASNVLY